MSGRNAKVTVASPFPYHRQRRDTMARTEADWEVDIRPGWTEASGIRADRFDGALEMLAKRHGAPPPHAAQVERRGDSRLATASWGPDSVAVLLIDSLTYNGRRAATNDARRRCPLVRQRLRPSEKRPRRSRRAAVYHDPKDGPDQVWPWDSLVLATHAAVVITKK
jgi:hypothetical protein